MLDWIASRYFLNIVVHIFFHLETIGGKKFDKKNFAIFAMDKIKKKKIKMFNLGNLIL